MRNYTQIAVALLALISVAPAAAGSLPPGTDLTRITAKAQDSDVIVLQAGEYPGVVQVQGKRLTIEGDSRGGTVLSGKDAQAVLFVGKKGEVTLRNIEIRNSAPDGIALFARDGTANLSHCIVTGANKPAVYGEHARIVVANSRFHDLRSAGIVGVNGSIISVLASSFINVARQAVTIQAGGRLSVADSHFETVGQAITAAGGDVDLTATGNEISAPDASVVIGFQGHGKLVARNNVIVGGTTAVQVSGEMTGPATIAGNTILNQKKRGLAFAAASPHAPAATIEKNKLIGAGEIEALLSTASSLTIRDNVVLGRGDYAFFLQKGATARFSGNIVGAEKAAIALGEAAGHGTRINDDVLIGGDILPDIVLTKTAKQLAVILGMNGHLAKLRQSTNAVLAAANGIIQVKGVGRIEPALGALQKLADVTRERIAEAASLSVTYSDIFNTPFAGAFTVRDEENHLVAKRASPAELVLSPGRYFVIPDLDSNKTSVVKLGAGENRKVIVHEPGYLALRVLNYDSATGKRHLVIVPLKVKDRMALQAELRLISPTIYATRRGDADTAALEAARKLALQRTDRLLKEVTNASSAVNELIKNGKWPAKMDKVMVDSRTWNDAFRWWQAILTVSGNESDAQMLVERARSDAKNRWRLFDTAVAIDMRLETLDTGAVAAALKTVPKLLAQGIAVRLHRAGGQAGDDLLRSHFVESKLKDSGLAGIVDNMVGHDVLATMRNAAAAALTEAKEQRQKSPGNYDHYSLSWQSANVARYLLAYGSIEDWKTVAKLPLSIDLPKLAGLSSDPANLVFELSPESRHTIFDPKRFAELYCSVAPGLSTQAQSKLLNLLQAILDKAAVQHRISGIAPDMDNKLSHLLFGPATSQCRADQGTAEDIFSKYSKFLRFAPWVPRPWDATASIDRFRAGKLTSIEQQALEALDHGVLVNGLGPKKGGDAIRMPELFLAYHSISDRRCRPDRCAAFLVNRKEPPGAVAVVLHARPRLEAGKIQVRLSFDAASYRKLGFINLTDPSHDLYTVVQSTKGASLVRDVFVTKGPDRIQLVATDDAGGFTSKSDVHIDNLADTTLHVRLGLGDDSSTVDLPIFAYALQPGALH